MAWRVASVSAWSIPALKSVADILAVGSCRPGNICDRRCAKDCMWAGGGMVGRMEGLERCPRERPGHEPAIARKARVPTGEVGVESWLAGVAEEPCPAGAEAVRCVAAEEVLVVDPVCDMAVRLGGARGCTISESDSQGRGERHTRERAWQSVSGCGTVLCLGTRLNICIVAEDFFCLWIDSYGEQGLDSWIVQAFNRSDRKPFSFRPRVVVYDAGTLVCVESRAWLVGVRWVRAAREGGASD